MGKRRRYDDEFRTSAVLLLQAAGYPEQVGALARVANHLKVPPSTLSGWANGTRNPPPPQLRAQKKEDLIGLILEELCAILEEFRDARQDASYKDLTIAFGILVDKVLLLDKEPTQRLDITSGDEPIGADTIAQALAVLNAGPGGAGCGGGGCSA